MIKLFKILGKLPYPTYDRKFFHCFKNTIIIKIKEKEHLLPENFFWEFIPEFM